MVKLKNLYLKETAFGDIYNPPAILWGRIRDRKHHLIEKQNGLIVNPGNPIGVSDHAIARYQFEGGLHVVISDMTDTIKRRVIMTPFTKRPWTVHFADDKPRYFKTFESVIQHILIFGTKPSKRKGVKNEN